MSKPSRAKLCVYCGRESKTTQDHVVPRCLFGTLPKQMITVKVCRDCNEDKSKCDSYLRDYLVMDIIGNEHPTAQAIFEDKIVRAVARNQSEIARGVIEAPEEPIFTVDNTYLGYAPAMPIDGDRIAKGFEYMVRGLYYHAAQLRLPDDCLFRVLRTYYPRIGQVIHTFDQMRAKGPFQLGDVFAWRYVVVPQDRSTSVWMLQFYERVVFTVTTCGPNSSLANRIEVRPKPTERYCI